MSDPNRIKFNQSKEQWDKYTHYFTRLNIPAKTMLLLEGAISKKAYLIESGCVRVWFNNKGKDITFQFFFEGDWVSSIESFTRQSPSLYSIETIEPCVLHSITKDDMDSILRELNEIPAIREHLSNIALDRQINYMRHFISLIKYTPKERYLNLLNENPKIIKRIPQHYIASYLGITSVSLSRIRNAILK